MQTVGKFINLKSPGKQIKNMITSYFSNLVNTYSNVESLEIVVPKNIYLRTQLICEHIQDTTGHLFDNTMFLWLLYNDFLNTSIEMYKPDMIRQEINRSHKHDEKLLIHSNDRIYAYEKSSCKRIILTITFDKRAIEKGELLLDELEDLYGQAPTLEKMIATLWINFIEDYKTAGNTKALLRIKDLLKKHYNEL